MSCGRRVVDVRSYGRVRQARKFRSPVQIYQSTTWGAPPAVETAEPTQQKCEYSRLRVIPSARCDSACTMDQEQAPALSPTAGDPVRIAPRKAETRNYPMSKTMPNCRRASASRAAARLTKPLHSRAIVRTGYGSIVLATARLHRATVILLSPAVAATPAAGATDAPSPTAR
jgi:hypothetical protein